MAIKLKTDGPIEEDNKKAAEIIRKLKHLREERRPKGKDRELKLTIEPMGSSNYNFQAKGTSEPINSSLFKIKAEGTSFEKGRVNFQMGISDPIPNGESQTYRLFIGIPTDEEYSAYQLVGESSDSTHRTYVAVKGSSHIIDAIQTYRPTPEEIKRLSEYFYPREPDDKFRGPRPPDEALEVFGELLKKILEDAGYVVTIGIPPDYFASPTTSALVSPVFALGLQKGFDGMDVRDEYEASITYLSVKYPRSKASAQMRLFNTPEDRIHELQSVFKDALSPYGLKVLYLVIEECDRNNRQNHFTLDTNRCLDLLGHKHTKSGYHQNRNRKHLLQEIEDLTKINFNVERRTPLKSKKGKEGALRFVAPLFSVTGKFEEFIVDEGKPIETGIKINESMQIYLNDVFYSDIKRMYTFVPMEYLRIDTNRNPHAVMLYPYISNQWKIGLKQYHGKMRQSMRRFLEGAGLLADLPKRSDNQKRFIQAIKDDLIWLKKQKAFWIKSVGFESKAPLLEQKMTIVMADNHPLKTNKKKQIEG